MSERLFLYIDILGFKEMVKSDYDVTEIYRRIDRLNVHRDKYFTCIVFSDTVIVYAAEGFLKNISDGLMWLIEFAQDLFYNMISIDVHIRAYITRGAFTHYRLTNLEAYYGPGLIKSYLKETTIKSTGVFLDTDLASHSNIFYLTKYDDDCHYVHVMQHLDDVSETYSLYPISGEMLQATGMEWWVAYLLSYLRNIHRHGQDASLPEPVRLKYQNAWKMIASRHPGLLQSLVENDFEYGKVIVMDWSEPVARIGTNRGAFE